MAEIVQQAQDPDYLSREAGKKIYGTVAGSLRRSELYRLGNAWGMQFPVGATKDFMLPFFKNLESQGKDILRPPGKVPLKGSYSGESHADTSTPDVIEPASKSEFETKLEALPHHKLKHLCRERGITQSNKDRKQDLIARIIAVSEGSNDHVFNSGQ